MFLFFKSLFSKKPDLAEDLTLAKQYGEIAQSFLLPLSMVDLDGPKWALKQADFMGGYLQGYADVLAQAHKREPGSQLAANLFIEMSNTLLNGAPPTFKNAFIEYYLSADNRTINAGLQCGADDANSFIQKKSTLPNSLAKHLGITG